MFLTLIFILLRLTQVVWSILCLGLSAGFIGIVDWYNSRATYNLVVSLLSLIYLVALVFLQIFKICQPVTVLIGDSIFFILWLAAFASIADAFGTVSCSNFYFSYSWCYIAKALIAFGVLNWLTYAATLILLIIFVLVPLYKVGGYNTWFQGDGFEVRKINSEPSVVPDVENDAGYDNNIESEGKNEDSSNNELPEEVSPGEALQVQAEAEAGLLNPVVDDDRQAEIGRKAPSP